jgi:hypothetical protein
VARQGAQQGLDAARVGQRAVLADFDDGARLGANNAMNGLPLSLPPAAVKLSASSGSNRYAATAGRQR